MRVGAVLITAGPPRPFAVHILHHASRITHHAPAGRPHVLVAEERRPKGVSVAAVGCEEGIREVIGLGIPRKSLCHALQESRLLWHIA
jgi:hypothetical protein